MKKEAYKKGDQFSQLAFVEMENDSKLDAYIHQMKKEERSLRGVLISGYTGTGKTFMAEHNLRKYEEAHPVLYARHHQQHEKIPYFGFKYSIGRKAI